MPVKRQQGPMLPARNTRLTGVARETGNNIAKFQQQYATNSINASGYPCTIYTMRFHGPRCTCKTLDSNLVNNPNISGELLDENGNLNPLQIENIVKGEDNAILEYDESVTSGNDSFTITDDRTLEQTEKDLEDIDFNNLMEDTAREILGSASFTSCGVCFGTGYVGGYDLVNGSRIVVDSSALRAKVTSLNNTAYTIKTPNSVVVQPLGSVSFPQKFPKAAINALQPMLYNNRTPIWTGYSITIGATVLTAASILNYCVGLDEPIVVTNIGNTELEFTHIEFVFTTSNPVYVDFPNVQKLTEVDRADPLSSVQLVLPPYVDANRGTVVIDNMPKLRRHWRISSVEPMRDAFDNVIVLNNCQARNVDPAELAKLLRPVLWLNPLNNPKLQPPPAVDKIPDHSGEVID